jgi:hypothetical protein
LGYDVAFHGLLLEAAELLEPLGDGLLFLLLQERLTSLSNGIHKLGFQQVVERVQLEALVEQLDVDLAGEAHQPHGLVLDLGDEGAVVLALRGNQLGDKVLAIGLRDGLTLAVKYVGQVVVVLLLRVPHLDVGEDEDTRGEVGMRTRMDAAHFLEDVPVPARQLLEIVADRLETIVNIFFIGIAT